MSNTNLRRRIVSQGAGIWSAVESYQSYRCKVPRDPVNQPCTATSRRANLPANHRRLTSQ